LRKPVCTTIALRAIKNPSFLGLGLLIEKKFSLMLLAIQIYEPPGTKSNLFPVHSVMAFDILLSDTAVPFNNAIDLNIFALMAVS
jgi:hypothetical protein